MLLLSGFYEILTSNCLIFVSNVTTMNMCDVAFLQSFSWLVDSIKIYNSNVSQLFFVCAHPKLYVCSINHS